MEPLLAQLPGGRGLGAQLQILPVLAAVDALHLSFVVDGVFGFGFGFGF